ncbi:MAG: hemerythrin domain-containing protein [Clostridiales bacterium]|nr:hemerythrin domain-containing protein [Clostridiales bacterium]
MINLDNLNRQHVNINKEIKYIVNEIKKGRADIDTAEAALHISRLAGLLRIHLLEEDKFLYPDLLKCSDEAIRDLTKQYIAEMGNLATEYTEFKNSYNTSFKIKNDIDNFLIEADQILKALSNRLSKEDRELYHLIAERKL